MTAGMTQLLICQRALADIGTRSTITSVNPVDGSQESFYCNLYYNGIRDHILRAANWNFAKRTTAISLWKALPGTPENPTAATTSGWLSAYPAPPWIYAYMYPSDCLRARSLIGQPQQVPISPPIFSGSTGTNPPISQRLPMARFEVSTDQFDGAGNFILATYGLYTPGGVGLTVVTPGTGYRSGDMVTLAGGTFGNPAVLFIETAPSGGVTSAVPVAPGTYLINPGFVPIVTFTQASTTGNGIGLTVTCTTALNTVPQTVILTNQQLPLLDYTFQANFEGIWDAMFEETMIAALAARLAQVLTGDKALANAKYALANEHIINARVIDGNEGLTVIDHMPDWLLTRGAGGGLGYEMFFYPLGPLFPLAPLI